MRAADERGRGRKVERRAAAPLASAPMPPPPPLPLLPLLLLVPMLLLLLLVPLACVEGATAPREGACARVLLEALLSGRAAAGTETDEATLEGKDEPDGTAAEGVTTVKVDGNDDDEDAAAVEEDEVLESEADTAAGDMTMDGIRRPTVLAAASPADVAPEP